MSAAAAASASLRVAELNSESVGDKGMERLGPLVGTSALTHLYLVGNGLGDRGATHLAAALRTCRSLQELYLSHNLVTDEGLKLIVDSIAVDGEPQSALVSLSVSANPITDDGALNVARLLMRAGCALRELYISGMGAPKADFKAKSAPGATASATGGGLLGQIGDRGVCYLALALLAPGCSLEVLAVADVGLGAAGPRRLSAALHANAAAPAQRERQPASRPRATTTPPARPARPPRRRALNADNWPSAAPRRARARATRRVQRRAGTSVAACGLPREVEAELERRCAREAAARVGDQGGRGRGVRAAEVRRRRRLP